jgi:hypothetical protein
VRFIVDRLVNSYNEGITNIPLQSEEEDNDSKSEKKESKDKENQKEEISKK